MFFSYNRLLHRNRIKKQNKYDKFRCSISLRKKRGKKRTFYTPSCECQRASLTVEASMVFPIFILAFWMLLYGLKITELQSKVQYALNVTAQDISAYSTVKSNTGAGMIFLTKLKSCNADVSFVSGNWAGFCFGRSEIMTVDSAVYLEADYKIKLPGILGIKVAIPCIQSVYTRAFLGKSLKDKGKEKIVYITTGQTVYHIHRQCSYLNLSIQQISEADFFHKADVYQKQYSVCTVCKNKKCYGFVYVTEDGKKYHNTLSCKSLKRTIERVMLKDVYDRRPCSRCSSKGQ